MIKIFYTSDVHGYIFEHLYHDNKKANLGLGKVKAYLNSHYDENSIFLDNGDILEGSEFLDYYYENSINEINPSTKALKLMNVDYINLGNHDFNYGTKIMNEHKNHFKCLTANIHYKNKPLGKTYIHEFKNKVKIALIGVCTHYIDHYEKEENLKDIKLIDAYDFLKEEVKKYRPLVDYVVVMYHGGFEKDPISKKEIEKNTGENQAFRMIDEIEGIDIFLSGHQHLKLCGKYKNTYYLQPSHRAQYLGFVSIDDNGEIKNELIEMNIKADDNFLANFKDEETKCQKWLDEIIIKTDYDLEIKDGFDARLNKHLIVSLLNQIQLAISGADISAVAIFNDAKGFKKEISLRDLCSTYVYPNSLVVLEVDKNILKEYLEKCAEYFTIENDQIVVSKEYYEYKVKHYNYDLLDGIEYTIKVSNPINNRIINLTKDKKEIGENDKFKLVVNNYRAAGGGDFDMLKKAKVIKIIDESMVNIIYEYLKKNQELIIKHHDNIKIIK